MYNGNAPKTELTYEEQRLAWRKALNDIDCRSMASDYLRGMKDEDNEDAYNEYVYRWGEHYAAPQATDKRKKRRKGRAK